MTNGIIVKIVSVTTVGKPLPVTILKVWRHRFEKLWLQVRFTIQVRKDLEVLLQKRLC